MRRTTLTRVKLSLAGLLLFTGLISIRGQTTIPASYAAPPGSVNTNAPGFRARVHQLPITRFPGDQNKIALAELQLANGFIDTNAVPPQPYDNLADLSLADTNGIFVITNVINWNQNISPIGSGVEAGDFQSTNTPPFPDEGIPGIPGINSGDNNIAAEVLTFLQLKAGSYQFGVNSDDGFEVRVGPDAREPFSTVLGLFDGGRGSADTLFSFAVAADGIYPFRLLYFEGGGGANVEWFSVDSATNKILINDRTNPNAVKAYRESTILNRPYVRTIIPLPGATLVPRDTNILIQIVDGVQKVATNSIKLFVSGQAVTPVITKPAGTNLTTISYDPPVDFAIDTTVPIRLVYSDDKVPATSVTNDWSFQTSPTFVTLFAINGTNVVWRYNREDIDFGTAWREKVYADSTWEQGLGPIGWNPDNTEVFPIQTVIMNASGQSGNFNENGVHYTTLYVRGHFNFPGTNTAGVRLFLTDMVDDGAVFYLNGAELHRFGIGAGVTFDYHTFFAGHEASTLDGPVEVPAASLVPGDNVFATEVHQPDLTSSDIVFGAGLDAAIPSVSAQTPKITSATVASGTITIQWSNGGTLESAPSVTGTWTTTGSSSGSFSEAATGAAKFYRVKQ